MGNCFSRYSNENTEKIEPDLLKSQSLLLPRPPDQDIMSGHGEKVFVALYDFDGIAIEDLGFKKGDHLEILDDSKGDFWYARSKETSEEGYIPTNLVAKLNSLEAESWYFGKCKRGDAEKLLLQIENDHGAFMVRESGSRKNALTLSVRDGDTVKHYRILQLNDGSFSIGIKTKFRTIQELVEHYSKDADGIYINLRKPCIQKTKIFNQAIVVVMTN